MRRLIDLWWAERNAPDRAADLAAQLTQAEKAVDEAFRDFNVASSVFRKGEKPGMGGQQ